MMREPDEAFDAAVLLVGHTGARQLEVGYLHDDVPSEQAGWWASATYQGTKIHVADFTGPAEAVEELAVRCMTGAKCTWCDALIALRPDGAIAYPGASMADGTRMPTDRDELAALGQCRWRRVGARWEPGCLHGQSTGTRAPRDRASRRRLRRDYDATRH